MNPLLPDYRNAFTILNLSDLHYCAKNHDLFEKVFKAFLEALTGLLKNNPDWFPDCLTLIGDIANKGQTEEYTQVKNYIDQIFDTIGKELYILPVPGNHDKTFPPGKENFKADLESAKKFLENYNLYLTLRSDEEIKIRKCKAVIDEYLHTYFAPYSEFIGNLNLGIDPLISLESDYYNFVGVQKIDQLKLCVVLLNTEWYYVPKDSGNQYLSVGDNIVEHIEKYCEIYRDKGYTVITLMHRSPYNLAWNDIYGSLEKRSTFDRIVDMSDLIICGHQHNKSLRNPDMVYNKTQLFQNGTTYLNKSIDGRYPYSVSLLKIEPRKRLIHSLQFCLNANENDEFIWNKPDIDHIRTFWMDNIFTRSLPRQQPTTPLYKEITFAYPISQERIEKNIKRLFYPTDNNNSNTLPSNVEVEIFDLLDKQIFERIQDIDKQIQQQLDDKLHHFILYCNKFYHNKQKTIDTPILPHYEEIHNLIRDKEIGHKIIINLVFCNFLY